MGRIQTKVLDTKATKDSRSLADLINHDQNTGWYFGYCWCIWLWYIQSFG